MDFHLLLNRRFSVNVWNVDICCMITALLLLLLLLSVDRTKFCHLSVRKQRESKSERDKAKTEREIEISMFQLNPGTCSLERT